MFGDKLGIAARAAQIAAHSAIARATPTRPATVGMVPRSPGALNAAWLTHALCQGTPGAQVLDFDLADGTSGTTSRRTLSVSYNKTGQAAGLPTTLFTKSTPDLKTKLFTGLSGLFTGEANFYNLIRPELDIESPAGHHASYDSARCHSMIIIEDVARTKGATFGKPGELHVDRERAEDMVGLMATYHGAFWADPRLDTEWSWLRSSSEWQRHLDSVINTKAMLRRGLRRADSVLPAELRSRGQEIWPAFVRSLTYKVEPPITLLHHDVHSKNWYVTADGRMGLYDWQTIAKGVWSVDLAYALNCGLEIEDRRAWLPDLLALYLDRLAERVADPPGLDEAWHSYRQQSLHGLVFWLATLGAGPLQPELQPAEDCLANIARLAQAVVDLDTFATLRTR